MVRLRHAAAPILLAGAVLAACGGENLFTSAVRGTQAVYLAESILVTSPDTGVVDLIAGGSRFELKLDEFDTTFEANFDHSSIHADVQGEFVRTDTTFVFSDDPFVDDQTITQRVFDLDEGVDTLILNDPDASFDLNDDGFAEPVQFHVVLTRQ